MGDAVDKTSDGLHVLKDDWHNMGVGHPDANEAAGKECHDAAGLYICSEPEDHDDDDNDDDDDDEDEQHVVYVIHGKHGHEHHYVAADDSASDEHDDHEKRDIWFGKSPQNMWKWGSGDDNEKRQAEEAVEVKTHHPSEIPINKRDDDDNEDHYEWNGDEIDGDDHIDWHPLFGGDDEDYDYDIDGTSQDKRDDDDNEDHYEWNGDEIDGDDHIDWHPLFGGDDEDYDYDIDGTSDD